MKKNKIHRKLLWLAGLLIFCIACSPLAKEMNSDKEKEKEAGTTETVGEDEKEDFYSEKISDEIFAKMKGKSYKDDCPVPRKDLRYLHVLHKNLEGETLEGELVCHKMIADDLLEIFEELYEEDYPIEKICLVDEYDADDDKSMTDNNTSCFNYRTVPRTNRISKHGLGIAVDINPLYNPYITWTNGKRNVDPEAGRPYVDRDEDFPYKIDEEDLCYELFTEHGFSWGGNWNNRKDYQHFQISGDKAEELQEKYQ